MTVDFDRIRIANPAPKDADLPEVLMSTTALLAVIDEGAGHMPVETQVPNNTQTEKVLPPRRGWLTAAIAFGVVLLVGAAIAMLSRQDQGIAPVDDVTATTEATQTAEAISPEMEAKVARAEEIIEIYNEGNLTAFNNLFQESAGFKNTAISVSDVQRRFGLLMALGDRRVGECAPRGDALEGEVVCELSSTDDLGGPLGIASAVTWTFTLSDNGKITDLGSTESTGLPRLIVDMGLWLRDAHPELIETLKFYGPGVGLPIETAAALLDLRDEFIEQSDEYSYTE